MDTNMEDTIPTLVEAEPVVEQPKSAEQPAPTNTEPVGKIPLTILTGFLGAGKTTLLNYIIQVNHGKRIAVIMNEFGDTEGIDKAMTTIDENGGQVEEWLDLKNGCMCCTVKDKGIKAIELLMKKRGRFDYILLETTGLADPGRIAKILWTNEELGGNIFLDGIVTLVDAKYIEKELSSNSTTHDDINDAEKQIAYADRVLINKTDLVDEPYLKHITNVIRKINPLAEFGYSNYSKINLNFVLDIQAYSADNSSGHVAPLLDTFRSLSSQKNKVHDIDECDHHHCEYSHIDDQIHAITLTAPKQVELSWSQLDEWLQEILWEHQFPGVKNTSSDSPSFEILRMKGIVFVHDFVGISSDVKMDHACILLQGVRDMYDALPLNKEHKNQDNSNDDDEVTENKIVFIGRNIPDTIITKSWNILVNSN